MQFTKQQMLDILVSWQQTLTPEFFPESKDLITEDFCDAVYAAAQELGILDEYKKALLAKGFNPDNK